MFGPGTGLIAVQRTFRHRVNVSTSVKGIKTWDCTVEGTGYSREAILAESDRLVAALEQRYPLQQEGS